MKFIGNVLDKIANAVCDFFGVADKDSGVVLGTFVIFVVFISVVSGVGLLSAWLLGIPWWSTWAIAFLYYMILVVKTNNDINSR